MAPAAWSDANTVTFLEICVEEVHAQNRPFARLNTQGKRNLLQKFNQRTGLAYTDKQMKNKWDSLKRDYVKWKGLKLRATGLGVDPATGNIDADKAWWDDNGGGKSAMYKFRQLVASHEDLLEVIFGNSMTTSECAFVPGVDPIDVESEARPEWEDGDGSGTQSPMQGSGSDATARSSRGKRSAAPSACPSGSRPQKRMDRDAAMHRFVNLYEQSLANRMSGSSVSSLGNISERDDVLQCLKLVNEAGAGDKTDEFFYASQLFMKPEFRNSFLGLQTKEGRLKWIKRTWDLHMKGQC